MKRETKTFSADPSGYYRELGIRPDANEAEIKSSYRDKAKQWHPDHNTNAEALEKFQKISVAYDIISDADKRLLYDLLARIYPSETFPDMFSLKIYKDRSGHENVNLRTLHLRRILGKVITFSDSDEREICSWEDAKKQVLHTSVLNWLGGWWSLPSIPRNIQALVNNFKEINRNRGDNLTLLVHNMLAYAQEKKYTQSFQSAKLALEYADPQTQSLIGQFVRTLPPVTAPELPKWNFSHLRNLQLLMPGILIILLLLSFSTRVMNWREFNRYFAKHDDITYYQEVRFNSGRTVDDVVVSKVVDIPVDTDDLNQLWHLTAPSKVMYGPDTDFDIITELRGQTTVRLSGYTPNKVWARVMIDSGEMGFVKMEILKKGIGRQIPDGSKIYTGIPIGR